MFDIVSKLKLSSWIKPGHFPNQVLNIYHYLYTHLLVDPLPTGCVIETKWSVHIALPQQTDNTCGQAYLCDISLPKELFKHIGIKYRSPFGIKFCIPIHRET